MPKIPLGPVLRRYFCEYLVSQRDLSPQTIGSYRDTFRLLLGIHGTPVSHQARCGVRRRFGCTASVDVLGRPGATARQYTPAPAMLGERRFVRSFAMRRRPIPCYCRWHSEYWQFLLSGSSGLRSGI